MLRIMRNTFASLRACWKHREFARYTVMGCNTKIDCTAVCHNTTGNRSSITIGDNCWIRCTLSAIDGGSVTVGDRTYIGGGTRIGALDSVRIGNDVIIAEDVRIYDNNNHPTQPEKRLEMTRCGSFTGRLWQWNESVDRTPIVIEDNVWIGERCTVLKGVRIGKGSVIGCNTVVTHDVPPYSVVAGNPGVVVKKLNCEEKA